MARGVSLMVWTTAAWLLISAAACMGQLDGFDNEQEVTQPTRGAAPRRTVTASSGVDTGADFQDLEGDRVGSSSPYARYIPKLNQQDHYYLEAGFLLFIAVYAVNLYLGRGANEQLALFWAGRLLAEGSVIDRNFALVGPGQGGEEVDVVMKDSASVFKLYASGRRYCTGLMATLDLRARQDLASLTWYFLEPKRDVMEVEVYMNQGAMPPMVLLVGTPKALKELAGQEDVAAFAHQVAPSKLRDALPHFPTDTLTAYAESNSVLFDLMKEPLLCGLFKGGGETAGALFRYLYFSTEHSGGSHKAVLRFGFVLPDKGAASALDRLVALVPGYIDAVATYRLSAGAAKRAEELRQEKERKLRAEEKAACEESMRERKLEKLIEERRKADRAGPDARARLDARHAKRQTKRKVQRV